MEHVREDPATAWTATYCLRPYHPRTLCGGPNPEFCAFSDGRLLDFKEGKSYAIEAESHRFREALGLLEPPDGTILVIVPGHEARDSNAGRPLARVVAAVANTDRRYVPLIDGLIRTRTVLRRSTSAERSFGTNIRSVRVSEPKRVKGAVVIALDDTVTTGTTFAVVRCLLLEAGASRVGAVALARTVKYF